MRIRYVLHNAYAGGGTVRTTLSMAAALAERGHDVEVASVLQRSGNRPSRCPLQSGWCHSPASGLASPIPARPATRCAGPRVALRRTHSELAHPRDTRWADRTLGHDRALQRYLRAQDDCVVIATRLTLNLALSTLRTDRQVAIGQEHNTLTPHLDLRADLPTSYPALDALAVLTEVDAAAYRSLLGDGCPVVVVPNALPHGTVLRRSPLGAPVAVAAGALTRRKGFDLLIDAWRTVAEACPHWRLRIYGTGEERAALQSRIERAGLTGVVSLEGFDRDMAARFDEASLFVLPSRREGMPMVVIEAMAAGLPVVAVDCPTGPAQQLDGGRSGVLVPVGDSAALAEGILRVVTDPAEQRRLADAAWQRVRDFDVAATAARWESLFAELADRRGLSVGR